MRILNSIDVDLFFKKWYNIGKSYGGIENEKNI